MKKQSKDYFPNWMMMVSIAVSLLTGRWLREWLLNVFGVSVFDLWTKLAIGIIIVIAVILRLRKEKPGIGLSRKVLIGCLVAAFVLMWISPILIKWIFSSTENPACEYSVLFAFQLITGAAVMMFSVWVVELSRWEEANPESETETPPDEK